MGWRKQLQQLLLPSQFSPVDHWHVEINNHQARRFMLQER